MTEELRLSRINRPERERPIVLSSNRPVKRKLRIEREYILPCSISSRQTVPPLGNFRCQTAQLSSRVVGYTPHTACKRQRGFDRT